MIVALAAVAWVLVIVLVIAIRATYRLAASTRALRVRVETRDGDSRRAHTR